MRRQHCLFLLLVIACFQGYSQLSDLHYLPPLRQGANNAGIRDQAIYLSTPETTAFTVNAFRGTNTTPLATFSISNTSPATYTLADGNNNITLVDDNNTGVVLTNSGLRFEAPGGERFYVNYRGNSNSQGASLTSKGRIAMGTRFKWGGVPNLGAENSKSNTLGIMATEDNTTITLSGYDPNCEFRVGTNRAGITANSYTITLDENESFVFETYIGTSPTLAHERGWIGASIDADKDIVISNGSINYGRQVGASNRDAGIDQPVPENRLGKEYVFIRGNGNANGWTEFPLIIATENNTQVFINGSATAAATLNEGDFFEVPSSNFSSNTVGANMYVETSKDVYAYQCVGGSTNPYTQGLNFVAPVSCLLPDTMDNIPNITDAAGITISGGVTIIAATTTPDANIIVRDGTGIKTLPPSSAVTGTSDWKTFYLPSLTGNVSVQSTGPVAVGFFGFNGARGVAGYFSGFDTVPSIDLEITGNNCLPGGVLEISSGETFDAYQWFGDGVLIPGATSAAYTATIAGDYFLRVTRGPCTYDSNSISVYYCNPDIQLIKTVDNSIVNEGNTVTFTITVQNFGVDSATNLVVTDILPAGLSLVSASPSVGTWASPNWNIGTLPSGTLENIDIVALADANNMTAPAQYPTNTASNTQDQTDSNITADSPSASVTILNDFDGDGVMDITDLDDDNDGILDSVECGSSIGSGTVSDPFTNLYGANLVTTSGRYYFNLGAGVFQADIDTSNGGGWVLILQYVHAAGTNPSLNVLAAGANLPEFSTGVLGDDESGSTSTWGHLGNSGFSDLGAEELRWYGATSGHEREIHFFSDIGINYAGTGSGNFSGINTSNTKLTGHTANVPDVVNGLYSNRGDFALTNFPFYRGASYHWGIRGNGNRWEVDDFPNNASRSTIHKVWARATTSPCDDSDSDTIPDSYELDSDNDGCSDANEAYNDTNADAGDGASYGTGTPPPTNGNGTVTAASYPTPADMNTNGTFDFQEMGVAPSISVEPIDQRVFIGNDGTVEVSSSDSDTYQWEVSTDGGTTFNPISDGSEYTGTLTDELNILSPDLTKNGYIYRALLTSNTFVCGQTLTNEIVLSVGPRTIITNRRITIRVNKD
ncbi:DUF11 domain-containing protein [Maribacter chungangensis]|uniref:DUF11 domain-containing protein n=1 Tax=Maribacter chungangensis TaxID=1069117 RepID=A0ABW3B1L4_9FLAO